MSDCKVFGKTVSKNKGMVNELPASYFETCLDLGNLQKNDIRLTSRDGLSWRRFDVLHEVFVNKTTTWLYKTNIEITRFTKGRL